MSHLLQSHPAVVADLLGRYVLTSPEAVRAAANELEAALRVSMQHTACYQKIPADAQLPAGAGADANSVAGYVHPENIAAAFQSLAYAAQAAAGLQVTATNGVQVYSGGAWHQLGSTTSQPVPVDLRIPPPAPVAPPPPAAAPIPPAPPAAPAQTDLGSLVDAVLGPQAPAAPIIAPTTVPAATPTTAPAATPTTGTQWVDAHYEAAIAPVPPLSSKVVHSAEDLNAHYEALRAQAAAQAAPQPVTAQGVPGPAVVTHAQAQAEQHLAPMVGLPTADVMADRTGATGRPAKSPFERPVELRAKVGKPPFWWDHLLVSAPKYFTDNPANALDPSSTGSGPVQAYAVLTVLLDRVLRQADPELTVAQLRQFVKEVDANMNGLPSRDGIYQIANEVFAPPAK